MGITLVTGLWDLGRNNLTEGWSRSYENHYLKKFEELLKINNNLIIFGDSELETFVWDRRERSNTQFVIRDLSWFKNNEFYNKIQTIRNNPEWYNQVGWLSESTQAKLEMYTPLVMGKMFLLHDAKILDQFESDYMFWIDAGLTNTVNSGYFTHDKVIDKIPNLINKFTFITFPYETNSEIHGFEFKKLCEFAGNKVNKVARGGFFGGPKETITEANNIYYQLLSATLSSGYMGTEESIFSIMLYKNSSLFDYTEIEDNGLVWLFFENLKNGDLKLKNENRSVYYFKKFTECFEYLNIIEKKINRIWKDWQENVIDRFAQLNYGYCITVNKSQGSTFKNVFIDIMDIFKNFNQIERLKCLYTAITRSSHLLELLV